MLSSTGRRKTCKASRISWRHTRSDDISDMHVIRDDELTLVTRRDGEIPLKDNYGYGLYYHDCRYLSGLFIEYNGLPPIKILSSDEHGFRSTLVATNSEIEDNTGRLIEKETILTSMVTAIPGCVRRSYTVQNFNTFAISFDIALVFDADFADIFMIRGIAPPTKGKVSPVRYDNKRLIFSYHGEDGHIRNTFISFDPPPSQVEGAICTFVFELDPHGSGTLNIEITVEDIKPGEMPEGPGPDLEQRMDRILRSYEATSDRSNYVKTSNHIFDSVLMRSLMDMNMMRRSMAGYLYHSAGVPWYDALFGRDSIISALQILPFEPELAKSTLLMNAKLQGRSSNHCTDEEPGKILHELRRGELANLGLIPQTPYYGTVDATPLFLILLAEYVDWTGDIELLKRLEVNADAALDWIDTYGDIDKKGFTSYAAKSNAGIFNQGWKDSFDAISHSDGALAKKPVALAEVQGYVYMAKKRLAPLFKVLGREGDGVRLDKEAEDLKKRFNRQFWMEDKQFFAQAQDAEGICDVISSNPAQCLWTGIIDRKYAKPLVDRLFKDDMFTGWGIRTLASGERRYNPLGYHNGTVWPHDNAFIVAGLRKYGFVNEMFILFTGMYDAVRNFELYRLPECFSGLPRSEYSVPVKYPIACSPQAWSSGAIPFMFIASLGIAPDALNNRLMFSKPHLPPWLDKVQFNNVKVGGTLTNLGIRRVEGETLVNVSKKSGDISVLVEY